MKRTEQKITGKLRVLVSVHQDALRLFNKLMTREGWQKQFAWDTEDPRLSATWPVQDALAEKVAFSRVKGFVEQRPHWHREKHSGRSAIALHASLVHIQKNQGSKRQLPIAVGE